MRTTLTIGLILLSSLTVVGASQETPEQALAKLGITLPSPSTPVANYVPAVRSGNLVFLSGQVARRPDGTIIVGKVGRDLTEAEAAEAARRCAVQLLAALQAEVGDLSRVKRIVRVGGFVNGTDDFMAQPRVINGCSDFLVAVFGDKGRHARTSVGVSALPAGAPVEIDMIVEVE